MASVINKATNKMTKGLVLDFSPENTSNEVLSHALNATLLTFNGNELSLLNDMGNARVETAFLPEGYIPVGTCEYGGIIYIVSYNPLEDKSLIGCFPSPERNISSDEEGINSEPLSNNTFLGENGVLKNTSLYILLKNDNLNPGDKFIVSAEDNIFEENLADLFVNGLVKPNPILKLNIVSIEDNGKIIYLNNELRRYKYENYEYIIAGNQNLADNLKIDIDSYRNVLSSGYNIFRSKTSGKLAILAELIMIDSYSVTHSLIKNDNGMFDVIIHTEASPSIDESNYDINPKLKYYYLKKSLGYLLANNGDLDKFELYDYPSSTINEDFKALTLRNIYSDIPESEKDKPLISNDNQEGTAVFNIPFQDTYHDYGDEFLITKETYNYEDICLASVKIPDIFIDNSLSFPFKYDYTIVPCMNYGKLDHLAVSNTVDFSKLNDFSKSNIHTWKYRIDDNQLRLTFGADIYDTYETDKVDALILEFYDLYGFAGSIEINNKKSYSGTFTKLVLLNTLNSINTYRVIEDEGIYNSNFIRNINIVYKYEDNTYYYNDKQVAFDQKLGWYYKNENLETPTLIENSDCGTLYSNVIYGVKTYLRKTISPEKYIFIRKDDFYLYTFPILNDYYYTVNNFNTLTNPSIEFSLTYKLQDNNNISPLNYNKGNTKYVENGYFDCKDAINTYLSGSANEKWESALTDCVRYFKYSGTTNVNLEIGLKEDYNNYNLKYDPKINDLFSCKIQLLGTENNSYILSNKLGVSENENITLNYSDGYMSDVQDENENYLLFDNQESELEIKKGELSLYNYLNNKGNKKINIRYNYIIGYKFSISNLMPSILNVPVVTTLCKKVGNILNYEDFGIEVHYDNDIPTYYSSVIFFSSGINTEEVCGILKQIRTSGNVEELCLVISQYSKNASNIAKTKSGNTKLNTEKLSSLIPYFGKYSFCLPMLHVFKSTLGVNIYPLSEETPKYISFGVAPGPGIALGQLGNDLSWGIIPSDNSESNSYFNNPVYTMMLNTPKTIDQNSEIICTSYCNSSASGYTINQKVMGKNKQGYQIGNYEVGGARPFIGLNGAQLTQFNEKLITTMQSVYAYEPDDNTAVIYIGDINVEDDLIKFDSYLISKEAKITFDNIETLNDYLAIGNVKISDYLQKLEQHSNDIKIFENDKPIPLLTLTPDLSLCGSEDNFLISLLTYNTTVPEKIVNDLLILSNDSVLVKPFDGSSYLVHGELNLKSLYGYDDNLNSLIELDVKNYTIANNGELSVITNSDKNNSIIPCIKTPRSRYVTTVEGKGLDIISTEYRNCTIKGTEITLNDLLYVPNISGHRLYIQNDIHSGRPYTRGELFYRTLEYNTEKGQLSYIANNTDELNWRLLFTGPCFNPENL